jgi:hypothetical protein
MRSTILALALLLPAAAGAEDLRTGPNNPALSAQPTPQRLPSDRAGPPSDSSTPRDVTTQRADDPARTAPPPGHRTMQAPAVPGATQPQRSDGYAQGDSPIPSRPADRRDASTTGRDAGTGGTQGGGR